MRRVVARSANARSPLTTKPPSLGRSTSTSICLPAATVTTSPAAGTFPPHVAGLLHLAKVANSGAVTPGWAEGTGAVGTPGAGVAGAPVASGLRLPIGVVGAVGS